MWKSPTRGHYIVIFNVSSSSSSSVDSFYKHGRKISAGDCALFKPPKDYPPFIGIIRCMTVGKENKLKLGVNWLYRPIEVRLGKDLLLENAPNEIFYSFHKDEIPATSLLHPCKVAFLPKGVELHSGILSFVCRRVSDVTNRCLHWLSDQDIDDHQEVDKLLHRTRVEMHAIVQPGGQSPKPGRKREKVDQGLESVKQEHSSKNDDGDSAVIVAIDKFDCLSRFVQLKGLPVFDEWLQEVHKGKIGDGIRSRDGDKSVDDFLLALQACSIGKSVNHLQTHKNTEIQKKARGLVDTWKKRVKAEMITNDAKFGSAQTVPWPVRQQLPEVAQGRNRHSCGSADVAVKRSVTQLSATKNTSVKIIPGENTTRSTSTSASPGSTTSVPCPALATTNSKDGQPRVAAVNGSSDLPVANARDEKSSSSSPSHNSQSYSSDPAKAGDLLGKEDVRSSTATSVNKVSRGSSWHRKSMNGFPDINKESWQSNDFKDILTGSDEGDGSPAAITDEEHCRTGEDCKKVLDVSKTASSSLGNESTARNLQDASYSSINALIEGVKYTEADDVGMNLLASVAAGEISKSELGIPAGSPEKDITTIEQSYAADATIVKSSEEYLFSVSATQMLNIRSRILDLVI
ncbi:product protein [Spatholobus suberectus]|nr:product protein [Spatholobus suberectus]